MSRQKAKFMSQTYNTGAFTTMSGMIGGVVKAVSVKPVLAVITFGYLSNVMIYAAASAGVGYVVKKVLDTIWERINKKRKQNQNTCDHE